MPRLLWDDLRLFHRRRGARAHNTGRHSLFVTKIKLNVSNIDLYEINETSPLNC